MYQALADTVLTLHVMFVLFVISGVPLILVGGARGWAWVRNPWFRVVHLGGIGVVVAQAWAGVVCPLTTLEVWLRGQTGDAGYDGSFIQHWLQALLYFEAPGWVFTLVYTLFGLLILLTWILVPPRRRAARHASAR